MIPSKIYGRHEILSVREKKRIRGSFRGRRSEVRESMEGSRGDEARGGESKERGDRES